jgi:rod shape-determining protein MreC
MQQLINFFIRYSSYLIFILLEAISIYCYFNLNSTQPKAAFLSSANGVIGYIYDSAQRFSRHWSLAVVNDSLAQENAKLKMQLPSAKYSVFAEKGAINDSLYHQQYKYTAALVVNNSINRANNYITINRGTNHGLRPNTGLVSATGNFVVGVVRKVSGNYSVAMSVLHRETRISAKISSNNYFGVLVWDGDQSSHLNLEALPRHAPVKKGDTVITSGYSTMFPEGVMVGIIDTFFMDESSNFNVARVRLSGNMSDLRYVYVVDDLLHEEREMVEKGVSSDE